jgi:hypothetical protein
LNGNTPKLAGNNNISGQVSLILPIWPNFEGVLEEFALPLQISLLQYVDDLLLFRLTEKEVTDVIVNLNFLSHQELRVSQTKLQFVEEEVRYLGHLISKEKCSLSPGRTEGITRMPLPLTKRSFKNS